VVELRVVVIVQARMGSSRFPKKVLTEIAPGTTVIQLILERLELSKEVDQVAVAIPDSSDDDPLEAHLGDIGASVFRGSLGDVQSRYVDCGIKYSADWVVRISGDCPLTDPDLVDQVVNGAISGDFEYFSNVNPPTMPDGLDVEVFKLSALITSRKIDRSSSSKEHVTGHLRDSGLFRTGSLRHSVDLSQERWTIDYPEDLLQIRANLPAGFSKMGWLELHTAGFRGVTVTHSARNEGAQMSEGQKLWSRAKGVIPGGSMLLSKRPEMFLPASWPTYYSKAKGIEVEDLEGNRYSDFATMSVGACSLGYGNDAVDQAVIEAVQDGVMSTLNSPAEVHLAEKLISLHSWAGMVRFARSGGEANAIAVRISRAHTKKDKVAICGYHGWHDWYLSANLGENDNLDGHLLPGLEPAGVPRSLHGTSVTFKYNDTEALEALLQSGEFAAVQMEVSRNFGPAEGFLERVRELCTHYGVILIFDECTSGFRETLGGLHLKYGVSPDIAMFGKALGNGYAITAVVGRTEVMQSAQSTFISSTFWTERLGPVAALATIAEMERQRSWELLPRTGQAVKEVWNQELTCLGLSFTVSGLDAMPTFAINAPHWLTLKTLFIQEMLHKKFLATGGFNASTAHDEKSLFSYRNAFKDSMTVVANNYDEHMALALLEGPVAHAGFTRLN